MNKRANNKAIFYQLNKLCKLYKEIGNSYRYI